MAPENIFDKPLATLTLGLIVNALLWMGAGLLAYWLFHRSDDPGTKGARRSLGVVLIFGAVAWVIYQFGLLYELRSFVAGKGCK